MGCVLYEMCALKPPFHGADMQGLYKKVCEGSVPLLPNAYSKDLYYVVKLMLQQTPKMRPSCAEILCKSQLVKNIPKNTSIEMDGPCGDSLINTIKVPVNLQ